MTSREFDLLPAVTKSGSGQSDIDIVSKFLPSSCLISIQHYWKVFENRELMYNFCDFSIKLKYLVPSVVFKETKGSNQK